MFLLTLAMLQPEIQPRSPPKEDTIVILGKRLKDVRFKGSVGKRGQVRCKISRSSGDPAIDAIPCHAVRECAARNLRMTSEIEACMGERLNVHLQALGVKMR